MTAANPAAVATAEEGGGQAADAGTESRAPGEEATGPEDDVSSRAEQLRFRRSMGLEATEAALVGAAKADNAATTQFGVPLTDAELTELQRRDQIIGDDVPTIRKTVTQAFGNRTFAGVWMDNLNGGVLTVAVTRSAAAVNDVLSDTIQHPESLRVVTRSHSLKELDRIASSLRTVASEQGRHLAGIRLDVRANHLELVTADDVRQTREWIATIAGDEAPVVVKTGSVDTVGTQYNNSPPLRGGQKINSSQGYTCTSAFTAHGPGGTYVLTAGHCGTAGSFWDQVGTPIGTADASDVTGTDVLRIPAGNQFVTNEVTLWYTPTLATEARYRTITSSQSASTDVVGQVSCITGQNFADLRCGEIITRSYDVDIPDGQGRQLTYTNGREIDADCNPGDSGGSALRGNQARGIVSVKVTRSFANDTCVYVHIDPAMNQIGVTDVLVDGPGIGT